MLHPYYVLDLPETATDEDVRRAYLRAIQAHPPDRDPEAFRRIHEAHELIKDEVARARLRIFGLPTRHKGGALADLVPADASSRRRIGIDAWIAAAHASRNHPQA